MPQSPSPDLALDASDLGRAYGPTWALSGVHVRLAPGASLLLAGSNGAGKTTLLRLLATTLRPTTGTLTVCGHDARRDPMAARRHLALLTHRTQLYGELSNRQMLAVTADLMGLPRDPSRDDHLLEEVGLAGKGDTLVRDDSAGMRKRLAFARLLIQEPEVVLLDEPYGQLDPLGFALVDRLIERFALEQRALVMSTHLVERAADLLDHGLVLGGGRPAWVGAAADLPPALHATIAA